MNDRRPKGQRERSGAHRRSAWVRSMMCGRVKNVVLWEDVMHKPDFLDRFDRLVAFDAETTGKRTPDADFIRRQPLGWKPPGIIIEVGFVEMLRDGIGWRKGETWCSLVNPDGPI